MESNINAEIKPEIGAIEVTDDMDVESVIEECPQKVLPLSDVQIDHGKNEKMLGQVHFAKPLQLSKKEQKRQFKLQKRLQICSEWKLRRKQKNKERKTRNKLSRLNLKKNMTPMSDSGRKYRIVIDFSYDELMSLKDLIKCGNQVTRCYSANRRSSNPVQLHFCNFTGKITEAVAKNNGYQNWDINFHENGYLEVFNKSDLVYLTSESRNILETIDEEKVYIIGGLVDHNAHKGVSYQKAVYEGISHAQLPLKRYVQMKSRSVLTINHVFEILLKVCNGDSWSDALSCVVPPRFFETNFSKDALLDSTSNKSSVEEKSEDKMTNDVDNITTLPTSSLTSEMTVDFTKEQNIVD